MPVDKDTYRGEVQIGMENIIFNELMIRECSVDIGIVYGNEKNAKGRITPVAREIDFLLDDMLV